jgi:prepilin-type N-terminal cleavage/methylation domain-containing protein
MAQRSHRRRQQQGFTFNELLVAMSIVGITVMGLSVGTVSVMRGNVASDHLTVAVNLAQNKIEKLKSSIHLGDENHCPAGGDRAVSASGSPGGIFNVCWTIEPSRFGAELKRVDVTVSWHEQQDRQITVSSLIFTDRDL